MQTEVLNADDMRHGTARQVKAFRSLSSSKQTPVYPFVPEQDGKLIDF